MAKAQKQAKLIARQELTGGERLGLRVSAMINHPTAQIQRWVTIHKLDTDTQEDWGDVMEVLAGTDGLEMIFNDDGTVTVRWEKQESDERVSAELVEEEAPF